MEERRGCTVRFLMFLGVFTFVLAGTGAGETNLLKNGDFSQGAAGWSDVHAADATEIAVVEAAGRKALLLRRRQAAAKVQTTQFNIRLKPQTLYRLSVTGWGDIPAKVALRPSSSSDPDFFNLCKSWATSTAPLETGKSPSVNTFLYDSGLKADSAFVSLYLSGETPGEFHVAAISLLEAGSSAPSPDETVIVHLGDSITITSYLSFQQRVEALLQAKLAGAFPAKKIRNVNLGVDGEFLGEMLDSGRYDKVIRENYKKIDVAVIRYGANDRRMYSVDRFKELLGALCDNLVGDYPGIIIVIGTGPYIHGSENANRHQYGPYWQAASEFAAARNYPLVEIYKRFEAEASEKTAVKKGDAHPSAYGVSVMADAEFEVLSKLLRAK
ncbi:MAG TPA: hypothetical protein ENN09_01090 [Planctomycetes bacterium]|nr:hypothetical protein [Planctomycetota bacterium]